MSVVLLLLTLGAGGFITESVSLISRSNGLEYPEKENGRTEYEMADVNGDGHPDIVSLGDHANPGGSSGQQGIMVWFGDGQGNWTVAKEGGFGYGGCALGDLNLDGVMDIAFGIHHNYAGGLGSRLIEAALGNGTGTGWTQYSTGLAENGESWGMFATDLADFDNDGLLDIICQSFGSGNGVRVYRNNGDGSWTQHWSLPGSNANYTLETGDFNADGNVDFICTRWGDSQKTNVYLGDGAFGFTRHHDGIPGVDVSAVDTGDFNNDGRSDILVSFYGDSGARVYSLNDSTDQWEDHSAGLPGGSGWEMVQFGHFNDDGFLDLALYSAPDGILYLGNGQGNWTPDAEFSFSTPGYYSAMRSHTDFDHDGRHDIVVQAAEGSIYTYTNRVMALSPWQEPGELSLRLLSPIGGEYLPAGSARFVSWLTAVPPSLGQASITLELSQNGPDGPWEAFAQGIPDNCRYQWTLPQINSTECRLRISASAGGQEYQYVSPGDFTIAQLTGTWEGSAAPVEPISLGIYPNPSVSGATVETQGVHAGALLEVFDVSGRLVQRKAHEDRTTVIDALPPGVYAVVLSSPGGRGTARLVQL